MDLIDRKLILISLYTLLLLIRIYFRLRLKNVTFTCRVDSTRQKLVAHLVTLATALPFLIWTFTPLLKSADLNFLPDIQIAGALLLMLGAVLLFWTHLTLSDYFSDTVEFRSDHQLIQTGPYGIVRHPMYSSALLVVIGSFLLTTNLGFFLIQIVAFSFVIFVRIPIEEQAMRKQFGSMYDSYSSAKKKILPWIF